jgi:hypothetical protein
MSATSTHPTLREELSRKTMDTIAGLLTRHAEGELSPEVTRIALTAVFDTVSGLVPWDIMDIIDKAQREFAA